jgi:biopolymer transport protein ExbD
MARKKKKVVEGDESVLNMTPMIDMTFLLVVFFMLTIDLTTKEFVPVELPYAYKGVEDTDDTREDVPRMVINLEADGTVTFKGNTYTLSSDSPMDQELALRALRTELMRLAQDPNLREPDTASMIPVLIHGDRAAKWQYVQWIMQVAAHPQIRIYKMQFAVKQAPDSKADEPAGAN